MLLQHPLGTALPQAPVPCRDTCPAPGTDLVLPTFQDATSEGKFTVTVSRRVLKDIPPKRYLKVGSWIFPLGRDMGSLEQQEGLVPPKGCSKSCSKLCLLLCLGSVWASPLAEVLGCTNYQWWAGTCLCSVGIVSLMRSCVLFTLQVVGSSLDEIYFSACLAVCDVSSQYHSSPCMNMKKERDICAHVYAGLLILITIMLFSCFVDQSPFSSPRQSNMNGCEDRNTEPITAY